MSSESKIKRLRHERRFTQIDNAALQDDRLTLKAVGLLCLALSLPDDWNLTIEWISRKGPDGRDAVRSAMACLQEAGYAQYVRLSSGGGYWIIREALTINWPEKPTSEKPTSEKPTSEKPTSEKPTSEKPTPYKDVDKPKTQNTNTSHETKFAEFWSAYPNKKAKPAALKAFMRAVKKTDPEAIIAHVRAMSKSEDWTKDAGRYVPYPATYLNGERWTDESGPKQRPDVARSGGANDHEQYQSLF